MAKQNTSKMVATYTTDFNTTITNIPVRWSSEAPVPATFYADRVSVCSFPQIGLTPRYIKATFPFGIHKYVVPNSGNIATLKTALISAGALCLDLIGEYWSKVPNSQLNSPPPPFKSTPYAAADITGDGARETGTFTYVSEVIGSVTAGYAAEAAPAALLTAAKAGLDSAAVGKGISNRETLNIEPRHYTIYANVDDDTTVARKALLSQLGQLANYADSIAGAAFYISYQGENAYSLHLT